MKYPDTCPHCGAAVTSLRCEPIRRRPRASEGPSFKYFAPGDKSWECENGHSEVYELAAPEVLEEAW